MVELSQREQRVRDKAASLIGSSQAETAWAMLHSDVPVAAFADFIGN